MRKYGLLATIALVTLLIAVPAVPAEATEAAKSFDEGKALLAQGNFDGAMTAFKAALKAEPDNNAYFQECQLLSQVLKIRQQLEEEQNAEEFARVGRGLFNYYRLYKVNNEALKLATVMYVKTGSGDAAAMLADAQLALDQNADAAELLGGLDKNKTCVRGDLLRGIALARLGKLDEAKAVAAGCELPKDCDGLTCFDAARLYALIGAKEKALATLKCSFEATPASWLAAYKDEAKTCKDLQSITSDAEFEKVLATASKLGGCGGCSNSKGCDKDKAGCKDKEKAGCQDKDKKEGEHKEGGCEQHKH